ncbi:DUF6020 family protein [Archangium sp.]|uniref:DUF6020 family protein n=1 Tax=Archangium sp. TaxID=1872627 RepID=UPI00389AB3C0
MSRLPSSFRSHLPRELGRFSLAVVLATALVIAGGMHLVPGAFQSAGGSAWGVAALAVVALSWLLYRWVLGRLVSQLQPYSRWGRRAWGLGSLLGAALLILAIPLAAPRLPWRFTLEVAAMGEKNAASQGSEVWVLGLEDETSGKPLPLEPTRRSGSWEVKDGGQMSLGRPEATLRWEGRFEGDAVLKLVRHPWSGLARVTLNGESQTVDLFSPSSEMWVLPLRADPHANASLVVLVRLSELLSIALLLLGVGLGVAAWPGPERTVEQGRWGGLIPPGVCAAVWSLYLLSFWPGFMTSDSMSQWAQMTRGPLVNIHPPYHTLTNWLITRPWESPAAVVLVQILALALAFGQALRELSRWGVPRWMRGVLTVLFALSPVNGAMVITLWKDIAYSIVHLVLFSLLAKLARTRGEALRSTRFLLGLGVTLLYAALVRHNGVPLSFALLAILVVIGPRGLRHRAGLLALGLASTFVLMTGPLFKLIGVRPMSGAYASAFPIHQMGAIAHFSPDSLGPSERKVLEAFQPWETWRDAYNCYSINPLLYNDQLKTNLFETPLRKDLVSLWLHEAPRHWREMLRHQVCLSSMVWRIQQPADGYLYLFNFDMEPNTLGLVQEPKLPALRQELVRLLTSSFAPERLWWVWRPALYLYLSVFFALIAAARQRSPWVLLSILPVVLNSLILLGLNVAQDFRYQYPVYVVALLSSALLFVRRGVLAREEVPAPSVRGEAAPVGGQSSPEVASA